jgi:hypothetical protein
LKGSGKPSTFQHEKLNQPQHKDSNLAFKLGSSSMRAFLLTTATLASILISNSMIAAADPLAGSATAPAAAAPTVHVQPRAEDFYPHSPASEAEQRRLSAFDAEQQKLDDALDKKLNVCRC